MIMENFGSMILLSVALGGFLSAAVVSGQSTINDEEFVSTPCEIKKGSFDMMVYKTDVNLPWYGERCEVHPEVNSSRTTVVQVIYQFCNYRYCGEQPCTCGHTNAKSDNRWGSNATRIGCFEPTPPRVNFTMYECCNGHQEIDHTCVKKINCNYNNGNCSDYCLNNVQGNYSYCGCMSGRTQVDFFTCAGAAGSSFPGWIIGAAIGGFFFLLLLLLCCLLLLLLLCRRRRKREVKEPVADISKEGFANPIFDKGPLPPILIAKVHPDDLLKAKIADDDSYYVDEKKKNFENGRMENDYSAFPDGKKGDGRDTVVAAGLAVGSFGGDEKKNHDYEEVENKKETKLSKSHDKSDSIKPESRNKGPIVSGRKGSSKSNSGDNGVTNVGFIPDTVQNESGDYSKGKGDETGGKDIRKNSEEATGRENENHYSEQSGPSAKRGSSKVTNETERNYYKKSQSEYHADGNGSEYGKNKPVPNEKPKGTPPKPGSHRMENEYGLEGGDGNARGGGEDMDEDGYSTIGHSHFKK